MSLLLTIDHSGDQINTTEMGRTCSTYGGRGEVQTGFRRGNMREGDHLELEYNIKMNLRDVGLKGLDFMSVAEDGDRWRDLVNAVMNIRVP
jgi:hypothetical protein